MNTITCTKRYSDYPFAHRQHTHKGHCALIHGHNWSFEFEFATNELDNNGFVIDFGSLKWLKTWLDDRFDHTLVLNEGDPKLEYLTKTLGTDMQSQEDGVAAIHIVKNCGAEGLAVYLLAEINFLLEFKTNGRVWLHRVTVFEDTKNSATVYASTASIPTTPDLRTHETSTC